MGVERKSTVLSEQEKRTTAYHEAGHALVAKLIKGTDPVHKVTIIPRGRALGVTMQLPEDDRHTYHKDYLLNNLAVLLGGRAAEEITLDQTTTGAGNDLERATDIARKMVCEWGMSEKLGPLTFGQREEAIFLGREIAQHRDYSRRRPGSSTPRSSGWSWRTTSGPGTFWAATGRPWRPWPRPFWRGRPSTWRSWTR